MKDLQRREFIKSAFLGANGLILSSSHFNLFANEGKPALSSINAPTLTGLVYQNDFTINLDGIKSYATLNLRRENNTLRFSTTNANRGIHVGTPYALAGKQHWLIIKASNPGRAGLKIYKNRTDTASLIQTITTTNEVVIPFTSGSPLSDNRLFVATAGPEYDVAIDYIRIYDEVSYEAGLWSGTHQQTINNRRYTWIPTKNATITPQTNGSVVLNAPDTKMSFSGANRCNRFIYDENYRRVGDRMLTELAGPGTHLPDGHHHLLIHYFASSSYDDVDKNLWHYTGNKSSYEHYSGQAEVVSFSIETLGADFANQVTVPPNQERVSWVITNQFLPEDLTLPKGKIYGITRMHWDVVPDNKKANIEAVFRKVSQVQIAGREEFGSMNPDKLWDCIYGHGMTPQQIVDLIPLTPGHSVMSQLREQGFTNAQVEQVFKLLYEKLKTKYGVTDPNQTNLFQDYFAAMDGYGNGASYFISDMSYDEIKKQLSSATEARKLYSQAHVNGDRPVSEYFSKGSVSYRNWGAGGYVDSFARVPKGSLVYRHIFEYEKTYMAANNRRTLCMSWSESEGVESETTRRGAKYRLRLASGDIIKTQTVGIPYELMKNQAFFSLLLGDAYTLWNDNANLVKNVDNWDTYSFDGVIEYQPTTASSPVSWDKNNPSHPKPVPSTIQANLRPTIFPNSPQIGEQGAWVGAYLYSRISSHSDRVSQSISYASFSYKVNSGEVQSGYSDGNDPIKGSLGNAELTRFGVINEGQHNIVDLWHHQKPIVLLTRGANGHAVIIKNVFCDPVDVVSYQVQLPDGMRTIYHKGRNLGVYLY